MIIHLHQLKKSYSMFSLVIPSLTIPRGSIFGFVGPNGAGKTTTLNILSGIIPYDEGEIKILGYDISKDPVQWKEKIGVLPEGLGLFDQLTGEEHLFFIGQIYGLDSEEIKKRSEDLIQLLDLRDGKKTVISKYSAGMKKKLAFASAIIHKPEVLFLDEPLESVDPISSSVIKKMLIYLASRGVTVIITSHNLEVVEKLCNEVAIINKGQIVFQSKTEGIRKKLKDGMSNDIFSGLEMVFINVVSENGLQLKLEDINWL